MSDQYPHPLSDPEVLGVPDVADDDSGAYDEVETVREADGPAPAAIPLDRDDHPDGIDTFGNTPDEQRDGESLDDKLTRETPDPAMRDPGERRDVKTSPIQVEAFDPDPLTEETDRVDSDTPLDDTGPVDPRRDSAVSLYDLEPGEREVGRLVEPDEGVRGDTEESSIARDAGAAGGAPTAEEAAIHEVDEP
ncbi:DUF5709 domain-containing protein [Phytohabitans sp. ZYX-F-186]|uniref:DUF5709 domain-containing protein n=1 Tax=Phytohabitans maris TaxID=3071409 RepID=A0ABU0ZGW8_9ACTN|nr:DUF5709 domain-containing protein [Phytohabitans sp. ZYX-F-186]MDQ7906296.1 DUF5709 domain-containing protein [Phytohabitans sp. ZYX-F-186]